MRIALFVLALLPGCTEPPCALDADVVPGCGAMVSGEPVRLGDTPDKVERALGPTAAAAALGDLGTRFAYPDQALSGLYGGAEDRAVRALYLHTGFPGGTAGGVGIGVDRATVRAQLGEPVQGLFLDVWWYQEQGIAVEWRDDAVDRLTLFPTD
ncbi:MAG: hypothetical protein JRI25_09470 [Deltaproteobacteria bacterium]|nr:hypothetical protein [Deltaproteobacteria bacterium]